MRYLLFLLLPLLSFGQIRSDQAAFRIGNTYVGLGKGGSYIGVIRPSAITDIVEDELYTVANALSRDDEADATTGLTPVGVTLASIESSPSPQNGTSLIEITSTDQNSDRFEVHLTLDVGVQYDIKYWAWEASGGNGRTTSWVGFSDFTPFDWTETPTEYTQTLTTNSSSQTLRFYNFSTAKAYVDGLSIKQTDATDPPPGGTVPEITLTTKYAFPGAIGAGRINSGGRGGSYYAVTNTNNSGTGSFREAVSSGSRIIIIKVEGRVDLASNMDIVAKNNVTVWGQFAPGRGLTLSGYRTVIRNSENWILRHMTFQNKNLTETPGVGGHDAINWQQDETGFTKTNVNGIIADHISARYGNDQTFSIQSRFAVDRNTVSYSLLAEGVEGHNTGGVSGNTSNLGQQPGQLTFARNMFYNLSHRFWNHSGGYGLANSGKFENYNQLFVNWNSRLSAINGPIEIDYFKNYGIYGNNSKAVSAVNKVDYISSQWGGRTPLIYSDNSYIEGYDETPNSTQKSIWMWRKTVSATIDGDPVNGNTQVDSPVLYTGTRQHNFGDPVDGVWDALDVPAKIYASVGHNRGINSDGTPGFFRDDKDATYITKTSTGTTESTYRLRAAWDNSTFTGESLYTDTDGDYMPDWFENQGFASLNPASAADRDGVITNWDFGDYTVVNTAGYTNLEMCAAYYAGDFETILDGTNDLNITE